MKKTFLAFAGTAALVSVLTMHAGDSPVVSKRNEKDKKIRRGEFTELNETEKNYLQEAMADSLAVVLAVDKNEIIARLKKKEALKDIILSSRKDEVTVKASLENLQETRMMAKLTEKILSGRITQEKADEIVKKMTEGKKNKEERRMYSIQRNYIKNVATILNIPEAKIVQSLKIGITPVFIAKEAGMDEGLFREKLKEVFRQNNTYVV